MQQDPNPVRTFRLSVSRLIVRGTTSAISGAAGALLGGLGGAAVGGVVGWTNGQHWNAGGSLPRVLTAEERVAKESSRLQRQVDTLRKMRALSSMMPALAVQLDHYIMQFEQTLHADFERLQAKMRDLGMPASDQEPDFGSQPTGYPQPDEEQDETPPDDETVH